MREIDEAADHQDQRDDGERWPASSAARMLRSSTAVLVTQQKDRVGDERRQEQRKLGEDGTDHRA